MSCAGGRKYKKKYLEFLVRIGMLLYFYLQSCWLCILSARKAKEAIGTPTRKGRKETNSISYALLELDHTHQNSLASLCWSIIPIAIVTFKLMVQIRLWMAISIIMLQGGTNNHLKVEETSPTTKCIYI